MPIIDLQRRMTEVGRLRMGEQVPYVKDGVTKYRAAKLANWRITSRDRQRLEAAAGLYGGEVREWEAKPGEFELYSTTSEVAILLVPGQTLSQWYELWSGGGCQRRCDGDREMISDAPCLCDTEKGDRQCKPTTRLSVMLPDVPGLGVWRLESHGYYAAVELAGTAAMLETATAKGQLLPARLRIDQRSKVEGGKTTKYAVPVIDIDITMRQALPEAVGAPAIAAGFTPVAQLGRGITINDGLDAVNREAEPKARNGRQAAPIGPAADDILAVAPPIPVEGDVPITDDPISESQRTLLWATCTSGRVQEDQLRSVVMQVTGQTSTKLVPRSRFDQVLTAVQALVSANLAAEADLLADTLVTIGEKTGKREAVEAAIARNRGGKTLPEHVEWLKTQIVRAENALAAIEAPEPVAS